MPKRLRDLPKVVPRPPETKKRNIDAIRITLTRAHSINGKSYGPGEVRVRQDLSRVLLEGERNAKWEEAQFMDRQPPGRIILPGGRIKYVDPRNFDEALNRVTSSF